MPIFIFSFLFFFCPFTFPIPMIPDLLFFVFTLILTWNRIGNCILLSMPLIYILFHHQCDETVFVFFFFSCALIFWNFRKVSRLLFFFSLHFHFSFSIFISFANEITPVASQKSNSLWFFSFLGKPCQRVGRYCPYHGVIKGALERQQHQNEYSSNNAATSRFKEFTKHVVEADRKRNFFRVFFIFFVIFVFFVVQFIHSLFSICFPIIATYIPASVSALPTTIEYSHTSASVIGKRKVDNYSTIVDTLINRPTKRFKHVDLSAEDIARQRFFQHAALEFERIREDQQHQLELQQLQHQIEAMREKAQQKDKVIESLERTISEMDRNLLSNPDKVSSDDISRWKLSTQKIYDDQLKNIF